VASHQQEEEKFKSRSFITDLVLANAKKLLVFAHAWLQLFVKCKYLNFNCGCKK